MNDIYYAARMMRKAPLFRATVVLTVALAIGGNITMFSFVNGALLRAHCRSPIPAAGIFPGMRAARLVPMTALRNE
jgi:hypothetical protein